MAKKVDTILPLYTNVTITVSTTTSAEVDLSNQILIGIITPSTFDGTAISFTGAPAAGGTHYPLAASNGASTAYAITTTASIFTPIDPTVTRGVRFIKAVCGTSQSTTDTVLIFVTVPRT